MTPLQRQFFSCITRKKMSQVKSLAIIFITALKNKRFDLFKEKLKEFKFILK